MCLALLVLLLIQPVKLPEISWFRNIFAGYNWLMEFLLWLRFVLHTAIYYNFSGVVVESES